MAAASGGGGPPKANNNKYFTCARCAITVPYHYHGRQPKFAPQMIFLEDAFVAFDPYAAEPRPLCVGSKCFFCEKLVLPPSLVARVHTARTADREGRCLL